MQMGPHISGRFGTGVSGFECLIIFVHESQEKRIINIDV